MPEHQYKPVPLCSTHLWGRQCHLSVTPTLLSAFKWPPVLGKVLSGGLPRQRCIKGPAKAGLVPSFWNKIILSLDEENAQVLLDSLVMPVILSAERQGDCVYLPLDNSHFLKIWGYNSVVKPLPSVCQILGPIPSIV